MSERSVPDELIVETNQNFGIVILSYTIMFLYVGLAIGIDEVLTIIKFKDNFLP